MTVSGWDRGGNNRGAELLAIVGVDQSQRVRCGQPGCGHSVYRYIHVVREGADLIVLGSTCFEKRYGGISVLGAPRYGGGSGKQLTEEERLLLTENTAALIAQFAQADAARQISVRPSQPAPSMTPPPVRFVNTRQETPWDWVKAWTSVLYIQLSDGSGWIRAQRTDNKHVLLPWPTFDGWDEALPSNLFGLADQEHGGYVIPDIVPALKHLRNLSTWESRPAAWKDVMAEITNHAKRAGLRSL